MAPPIFPAPTRTSRPGSLSVMRVPTVSSRAASSRLVRHPCRPTIRTERPDSSVRRLQAPACSMVSHWAWLASAPPVSIRRVAVEDRAFFAPQVEMAEPELLVDPGHQGLVTSSHLASRHLGRRRCRPDADPSKVFMPVEADVIVGPVDPATVILISSSAERSKCTSPPTSASCSTISIGLAAVAKQRMCTAAIRPLASRSPQAETLP